MWAVLILLIFFGTLLLRKKLYRRSVEARLHKLQLWGVPWAALLQPHTFFFSALVVIYLYQVFSFVGIFSEFPWLDPQSFHLPSTTTSHERDNLTEYEIPSWLRWMCMMCPTCIGLTLVVTLVHLWQHFPKHRGFDEELRWFPAYSHDLAMQVVALPLVYGLFALDCVSLMLRLMTGDAWHMDVAKCQTRDLTDMECWNRTNNYFEQAWAINFELADLYEAWALRSFGVLCFVRVSRQVQLEAPTVQYIIESVKRHMAGVQIDGSRDRVLLDDLKILNSPQELLFEPLQQTAGIGVMVFVYTYGLKSAYLLALGILADPPISIQLCGSNSKLAWVCSFSPYVDGAAFLASTLAIYNIVVFEHKLKDILSREKFRPWVKFLCVKMLVSIAFLQDFALSTFMGSVCGFSQVQINLCYSALTCFEVLPISLLVFVAWRPAEHDWYSGDRHPCATIDGGPCTGQLAGESNLEDHDDAFVASRQLSHMMNTGQVPGPQVAATIELHGQVTAKEGKALEDLVNAFSRTMIAVYKPAAFFRGSGSGNGVGGLPSTSAAKEQHQPLTGSLAGSHSSGCLAGSHPEGGVAIKSSGMSRAASETALHRSTWLSTHSEAGCASEVLQAAKEPLNASRSPGQASEGIAGGPAAAASHTIRTGGRRLSGPRPVQEWRERSEQVS